MSSLDKAVQTQLDNIQKKTGKSLDELATIVQRSGLKKHGEIRDYLKSELGLGHGDANALVHVILKSDGQRVAEEKMKIRCWMKFTPARRPVSAPFTKS
jgi:hypothetical protein